MGIFRKSGPETRIDSAVSVMAAEIASDENEQRGLINRPRYVGAKRTIVGFGREATDSLLLQLDRRKTSDMESTEYWVTVDIIETLGDLRDPRAVPKLTELLSEVFPTLGLALAKTDDGTKACLRLLGRPTRLSAQRRWEYGAPRSDRGRCSTRSALGSRTPT